MPTSTLPPPRRHTGSSRDVVVRSLQREQSVVHVARPEAEDRGVAGPGHHHPEAVRAKDGHHVELDGKRQVALVDGAPVLGGAHPARVDPAVSGVEEHRLTAVTRSRRVPDTGAVGEERRIERPRLVRSSAQCRGHRVVPRVGRRPGNDDDRDGDSEHSAARSRRVGRADRADELFFGGIATSSIRFAPAWHRDQGPAGRRRRPEAEASMVATRSRQLVSAPRPGEKGMGRATFPPVTWRHALRDHRGRSGRKPGRHPCRRAGGVDVTLDRAGRGRGAANLSRLHPVQGHDRHRRAPCPTCGGWRDGGGGQRGLDRSRSGPPAHRGHRRPARGHQREDPPQPGGQPGPRDRPAWSTTTPWSPTPSTESAPSRPTPS